MICNNCKSPDCRAEVAGRIERLAYALMQSACTEDSQDRWKAASEAEEQAQSDCAHRAAYRTNGDTLARMAAIEARQDRIEAVLRAKGWM